MQNASKEIRWFTEREYPVISSWLLSHGLRFGAGSREDFYMPLPDNHRLGIKIREGKLEIKERTAQTGLVKLAEDIEGHMELWAKTGFSVDPEDDAATQIQQGKSNWISCKKDRIGLKVYRNKDGVLVYAGIKEKLESGCQIEYTKINVAGEEYYSFCFEWFGNLDEGLPKEINEGLLLQVHLRKEDSMSYPEFFDRL